MTIETEEAEAAAVEVNHHLADLEMIEAEIETEMIDLEVIATKDLHLSQIKAVVTSRQEKTILCNKP